MSQPEFTPTSRIVIIGSGIVGAAVADELTQRGAQNVTVVEQGPLFDTGGSSSHAPGFVFQINPSKTMCELAQRTLNKLDSLSPNDENWLLRRVGGLELATTEEQLAELKRRHGYAQSYGVPAQMVLAEDCAEFWPQLDTGILLGALHTPSDAVVHGKRSVKAQAERAIENGATFLEHVKATGLEKAGSKVTGVSVVDALTGENDRVIPADFVVAAGGIWGPTLGSWLGVNLPMQPVEHGFAFTEPLEMFAEAESDEECLPPLIRHQGAGVYLRQQGETLAIGAYEHRPIPVRQNELSSPKEAISSGVHPAMHEFTDADFDYAWDEVQRLFPELKPNQLDRDRGFNGIFSFTPDGGPLLGPSPTVDGVWVAQAVWVTHSAGVAEVLADWMTTGNPGIDTSELDLSRFDARLMSEEFGIQKGLESYDEVYDIRHPREASTKLRKLRTSPFYAAQERLGAKFVEANGWERPLWLEENRRLLEELKISFPKITSWDQTAWSPIAVAEAWATRNRVAMYDMTSLYRLRVKGENASDLLQRVTSNKVAKAPGSVTYSLMLDQTGGILSDVTVTRISENEYWVGGNGPADQYHLLHQRLENEKVEIEDITPGTCCVGLWGPQARRVLEKLTHADISNEALGYFKAKSFYVAGVPVLALRVSYVGELGWEIYTSADHGQRLWEEIYAAGQEHGIIVGGRLAFNSLRLEKGYRSFGADMTREHSPEEAGLGFAVGKLKEGYLGYDGLKERAAKGPQRRLVTLVSPIPYGVPTPGCPVYGGTGRDVIGYTASADFGYTVNKIVTYAWLDDPQTQEGNEVTIQIFGRSVKAVVAADVLVDPEGKKLRYP